MSRLKRTALVTGVLGALALVAAAFGPFISGEAVEGVLERLRRAV